MSQICKKEKKGHCNIPEPTVTSSNCFFSPTSCQKSRESSFTLINVKEQIVLTVKDTLWNFLQPCKQKETDLLTHFRIRTYLF